MGHEKDRNSELLTQTTRIAFAALLHDIGKFAERARIESAQEKDSHGDTRRDINVQLYCPKYNERYSHIHAAYTAIAMDLIEKHLPELVGEDMTPFAPWRDKNADDSVINAAAMHHKPQTFLQWVIATADRVSSGFEREKFEEYNRLDVDGQTNHYTGRQITLFEQIRVGDGDSPPTSEELQHCYALKAMSVESLFPVARKTYEHRDTAKAQAEYKQLWEEFSTALGKIPASHRKNLPLWLDHFDTLWQVYTHAIPSATASRVNLGVKADVSLYDHSHTTAALATALWRYHHESGNETGQLKDWDTDKFLLIQGDFFGIQKFIFASGGETHKWAAKLLRGRSFYVSLLTECAAQKVLDTLGLPITSVVTNAAGKFLIVAPNTKQTIERLGSIQRELDDWFLNNTYGESGVGIACLPASCNDFTQGRFEGLMKSLFEQLEQVKLQRFSLCSDHAPCLFEDYLDEFDNTKGVCAIDGRSPASIEKNAYGKSIWVSKLANDQIKVGDALTKFKRFLLTRDNLDHNTLKLPIFGYFVSFTGKEDISGKFGPLAESGKLARVIDFSLPEDTKTVLWNGYARRAINAYIPRFSEQDLNAFNKEKYREGSADELCNEEAGEPKTLNHLADEDRFLNENDHWIGISALNALKGDVDNLGLIFQKGMGKQPSFARMASLSRQMNAFFAVWLPDCCREHYPNTYTVFAGGDDFFLIGPWKTTMKLASHMCREFQRYVAYNPQVHFSAGLSITKPGLPIHALSEMAENALDDAKNYQQQTKNAITCFGQTTSWDDFDELIKRSEDLGRWRKDWGLSTAYVYSLLSLVNMAEELHKKPENSIWLSRFRYRTYRTLEAQKRSGLKEEDFHRIENQLFEEIAHKGIEAHKGNYRIALYTHLYQNRR